MGNSQSQKPNQRPAYSVQQLGHHARNTWPHQKGIGGNVDPLKRAFYERNQVLRFGQDTLKDWSCLINWALTLTGIFFLFLEISLKYKVIAYN
jgi:hypothetical protein